MPAVRRGRAVGRSSRRRRHFKRESSHTRECTENLVEWENVGEGGFGVRVEDALRICFRGASQAPSGETTQGNGNTRRIQYPVC